MTRHTTPEGRVFDLVGRCPYTRKDGSETELLVWESLCAVCAAPFEVTTPVVFSKTQSFGMKHCPEHRLSQAEITARGLAALRAIRAKNRTGKN